MISNLSIRHRVVWGFLAAFSSGIVLSGCDDPKQASNTNFQKLVRSKMARDPSVLTYRLPVSPMGWLTDKEKRPAILAELVKVGLLAEDKSPSGYKPGPNAQGLIQPGDLGPPSLIIGIADPDSVEVVRFSEPATFGPHTVSEVKYTHAWRPSAVMTDPRYAAVQAIVKNSKPGQWLALRAEDAETLVLYSDGWCSPR